MPDNLYWNTVTPLVKSALTQMMKSNLFSQFRLVGGTSLSLQLGHRESVDIDLFTDAEYGSIDFTKLYSFLKKLEFNRDPKKRIQQNNKSALAWYPEFIAAKEKEIGEGINSYRSTHEHFKKFAAGRGVIYLQDLTKQLLEQFRDYLEKLNLGGQNLAAYSRYVDVNKDSMVQANKQWDNLTSTEAQEPEMAYQKAS